MEFPHDVDSERALVAALAQDATALDRIASSVSKADFYDERYGTLYDVLANAYTAGQRVTSLVGLRALTRHLGGEFDAAFWRGMLDGVSHYHAAYYADIVRNHAAARRVAIAASEAIATVTHWARSQQLPDADALVSSLRVKLDALGAGSPIEAVTLANAASDAMQAVRSARKPSGPQIASTGLYRLDSQGAAMRAGTVTILAARPGGGKSALAMQVAMHNAGKGRPVLFASCEMRSQELALRVMAGRSGVDFGRAVDGTTDDSDVANLAAAAESLESMPVRIVTAAADIDRLCSLIRLEHARGRCQLAVVDYLQLLKPSRDDARSDRHLQVAGMTRRLKLLANDTGVALLVLSQLSRAADGEEPRLSHLRESGSIEQDADNVWMLHRPDQYGAEIKFIAAKLRNGRPFSDALIFDGPRFQFNEPEQSADRVDSFDDFNGGL